MGILRSDAVDYLSALISVVTLTLLEIVLGLDNIVFLTILTEPLPQPLRQQARRWGLLLAWVSRIILLSSVLWLERLTKPVVLYRSVSLSVRDLLLCAGGLFLLVKATQGIHDEVVAASMQPKVPQARPQRFLGLVLQIAVMDLVFSIDSVLTAVGLTNNFWAMAIAMSVAIGVMLFASDRVGYWLQRFPSLKLLALNFLMLIGVMLLADGCSFHIPRSYVYFAMGFALGVEWLNLLKQRHRSR